MRRGDRGATTVELALLLPLVMALLTGLVLLGVRAVYAGVAQNAARAAVQTAVLPQADTRTLSEVEACDRALASIPSSFAPEHRTCNGVSSAPQGAGAPQLAVQVCPPSCSGFTHSTSCTALPATLPGSRVRALSGAAPRPVALRQGTFGGLVSASPTPDPLPTLTPDPTVSSSVPLPSASVPLPPPPSPPSSLEVVVPGATLSAEPLPTEVVVPSADVRFPLPGLPTPAPTRAPRPCSADREGRLVAVQVSWRVGVLDALVGLTGGVLGEGAATVTATATGRRE